MGYFSCFPFVRIALAFILGITAYAFFPQKFSLVQIIFVIGFCFLFFFTVLKTFYLLKGFLAIFLIFTLGYIFAYLHYAPHHPKHFAHCWKKIEAYEIQAIGDVEKKTNSQYLLTTMQWAKIGKSWKKLQGKVVLYFPKTANLHLHYGDKLLIIGKPQKISGPQNPNEFNYKQFLAYQNIYHCHFITEKNYIKSGSLSYFRIQKYTLKLRKYFEHILTKYITHPQTYGIVLALLLGNKDALDQDVKTAYAGTGAMHILAVSGLHVGILYWILSLILNLIPFFRRNTWLYACSVLVFLWFYTLLTGLSPSVMRASTMFSFIVWAKALRRTPNIYNTLSISAFFLLCIDPFLLFSVSFQLSYLAVLGIVYLQPKIYHLYQSKFSFVDKLWMLSSVSIAAQIATTPISIYYFQQYPTYFLFANWVVVPAAVWMLLGSIIVLLSSFNTYLHIGCSFLLEKLISGVNQYILWLSALPYSQVKNIAVSKAIIFLLYLFLLFLLWGMAKKKFIHFVMAFCCFLYLSFLWGKNMLIRNKQQKIIIYSIPRHQCIAFCQGRRSILWLDKALSKVKKKITYHIMPNQMALGINNIQQHFLDSKISFKDIANKKINNIIFIVWKGKIIVYIPQPIYALPPLARKINIDFLYLNAENIKSLNKYCAYFHVKQLILGHKIDKRYLQQIKQEALGKNIPYFSLKERGAWQYCF